MSAPPIPLAATLESLPGAPRAVYARLHAAGWQGVQISAAAPGFRPRELGTSARRDLLATLRRRELVVSGVDAWIPEAHLRDVAHIDRAVDALRGAVGLAADLGRVPLSVRFPALDDAAPDGLAAALSEIEADAGRRGVPLADHALPPGAGSRGIGIDPAAWLAAGEDPVIAVAQYGERVVSCRLVDLLATGQRGPIGRGPDHRLDVDGYRLALQLSPRAQPVIVDARQWPDPWGGLEATALAWA
jgi:sugar phosphate isomerase/epimerase